MRRPKKKRASSRKTVVPGQGEDLVASATMDDIAREARVSAMTVSRVLSGRTNVSEATREKVLATARRHNYEVNVQAQRFAQKRSGFIALATPVRLVGSAYFGKMIGGFESVFAGTGWDYALFNLQSSSFEDGNRLMKLFRGRRVDGALVVAPNVDDEFLDTLTGCGFPLIVVGKEVNSPKVCWVACDDYGGIYALCEHLFALGHRRIAFLGGPAEFSAAQRRERAYVDFCERHSLPIPDDWLQRGNYTPAAGRAGGMDFLRRATGRPSAIIAANDGMALGILESARELGLAVPGDVSVAGFDDLPMAAECFPALTTAHQPVYEMAAQSAAMLREALEQDTPPSGHFTLPVSIVERASTAPPPA